MEEIRNAEGLRICPECGKPKEAKKELFLKEETVPIACDCVKAEEARFREREERERRDDVTDKLKTYDLVVFDDYAAERKTDYMNEKIKEAVDMRINAGLPMIVTTNMTKEELLCPKDVSEERVFSR